MRNIKGIVLAGGAGTRLYPITKVVTKQLLPIYDKPMIYYPIATLMNFAIKNIMIISTPTDLPNLKRLLGNGDDYGVHFEYAEQPKPEGIAQALIIAKDFIGDDDVCLILGDNIFYGNGFDEGCLHGSLMTTQGFATVFGYPVNDPQRYGVVEVDKKGNCISIEEKPKHPKSNYAVTGLYFYPNQVLDIAKNLKPSDRGELEITDVNKEYLKQNKLKVQLLKEGFAWFDAGTFDSLYEASSYVQAIEKRQGTQIACLETIALNRGWINKRKLKELAEPMKNNQYGKYILNYENTDRQWPWN